MTHLREHTQPYTNKIHVQYTFVHVYVCLSLYGAPLTQRASYLALEQLIMIILSLTALTLRCIPNGTHTTHCWANLAHASILMALGQS